jgi:hypothetical protein
MLVTLTLSLINPKTSGDINDTDGIEVCAAFISVKVSLKNV